MEEEKTLLKATLCLLVKDNKVLLGVKTKKIGKGCWNGYGGGIEEGETPEQAALRELKEEAKVVALPEHLEKVAVIDFYNNRSDGSFFVCQMHVYIVSQWTGEPQESDEMATPTWFDARQLPTDKMLLADKEWLPVVLNGKKIRVAAEYGPFQKTLIGKVLIQQVDSFSDI